MKGYLEESGASLDNELSFYCGTGWRATIPFLICYENGMTNMTVYDGGWYQWQMDDSLPVQVGIPRKAAASLPRWVSCPQTKQKNKD